MEVVERVLALARGLTGRGWAPVFAAHGIDLGSVGTEADLLAARPGIDRTRPGFEDFAPDGLALVQPGDPARSLLYHALAHPSVHPTAEGRPGPDPAAYPTLEEIDLVEDAVYALARLAPAAREGLVPAVFAYQYREATRTPHRRHADLVFSRLGISRVGDEPARYDPGARGWTQDGVGPGRIRATAARFAVFLARPTRGPDVSLLAGRTIGDRFRTFLVPVHKVFRGPDCLPGASIDVAWASNHRDEKLRRAVTRGGLRAHRDLDIDRPPFVREGDAACGLVDLVPCGSGACVSPPAGPLVRDAEQPDPASGRVRLARVLVPEAFWPFPLVNRRYTTLHVLGNLLRAAIDAILFFLQKRRAYFMPRTAPEFVNIRHEVVEREGREEVVDLGAEIPDPVAFEEKVRRGGYWALLFEDGLCEGCLTAEVEGLDAVPKRARAAWSVVAAPDFFPRVDQVDLSRVLWTARRRPGSAYGNGGPAPLCRARLLANPVLKLPGPDGVAAFPRKERTLTAIVSATRPAGTSPAGPRRTETPSWLSDAAAQVFAPGWDTSYDGLGLHSHYAAYGLGAPYPEDVKLCAAGGGSWPGATPDASRTFRRLDTPTAIPLTDAELGRHPRHPRVLGGAVDARPGWDGEHGPFLERVEADLYVNYADIERVDYVSNARNGRLRPEAISHLDAATLIARMDELRLCVEALDPRHDVGSTRLWLVELEEVDAWEALGDRPPEWTGRGHRWTFAEVEDSDFERVPDDPRRRRARPSRLHRCRTRTGAVVVGGEEAGR